MMKKPEFLFLFFVLVLFYCSLPYLCLMIGLLVQVPFSWVIINIVARIILNPLPWSFRIPTLLRMGIAVMHSFIFFQNLMLHRHPCILKYIASWTKSGKLYLATEDVRPLSHVINSLTSIQKCIGLYSILKALVFLHEQVRYLNYLLGKKGGKILPPLHAESNF